MKTAQNLFILLLTAAISSCGSCSAKPSGLSPSELKLASRIGFDKQILLLVKDEAKAQLQQLTGFDRTGHKTQAKGLAVAVSPDRSEDLILSLRRKIASKGYLVFLADKTYGSESDRIGVLRGHNQYDILKVMQTNGANYSLDTSKLIAKLKSWEKQYPFEVMGAGFDWVDARFVKLPQDVGSFAKEVYKFCPDIVDQGTGSVDALAKEMTETKGFSLWWD